MKLIGIEFTRVSNFQTALVVHDEMPSLDKPGRVLVKWRMGGRDWFTYKELSEDFVIKTQMDQSRELKIEKLLESKQCGGCGQCNQFDGMCVYDGEVHE